MPYSSDIPRVISYGVATGTSIVCVQRYGKDVFRTFPGGAYGCIIASGVAGMLYWGLGYSDSSDFGENLYQLQRFTEGLCRIFPLPCVATQAWLNDGLKREYAWAHCAVALIPLLQYLSNRDRDSNEFLDLVILGNAGSLGYVMYTHENWYGVGAAALFAIIHFVFRKERRIAGLPSEDVSNYGNAGFAFLVLKALKGRVWKGPSH